ncbi:hypothetical protein KUF71_006852 [Frankliniella fusca]|uniref:Uncharacterized protein n=1 Tax=Frankliniella fusca TaxID=407009 RepID=A0AAE1H9I1_9NEOP|nr:hypothetical protein KUF71_006852 [Frankliniella fusca]
MRLDATRSDLTSPVACPNESSELSQEVLASVARKGGKNRPTHSRVERSVTYVKVEPMVL